MVARVLVERGHRREVGVVIKEEYEGSCDDGTVLYLNYGDGHTNLHR